MGHQGKNLPGFERVCGGCQKRIPVFTPDNVTIVDVCTECWGKLSIGQRLMILQEAKQAKELNIIANILTDYVHSGDALRGKLRRDEGN